MSRVVLINLGWEERLRTGEEAAAKTSRPCNTSGLYGVVQGRPVCVKTAYTYWL